ncbi:hypothetical protein H4R26_003585 [Coemansia thaxteri]|uniref:U2 snRNP-associated SURP motif-containing protein n=1 Tax=Coemansia thaxteri TaxID=2663907 RepID=A0A9W8EEH4_9FUNG|nr:hypothetical protein H4R26_003585 [Coemansia thaxteri]KAJ2481409.1 hypothetical protein EV174_003477 [Coemansia sp. RSA 2320]
MPLRANKVHSSVFDSVSTDDDAVGGRDNDELTAKEAGEKKKRRNLDVFLEELKRDQEQRRSHQEQHRSKRQNCGGRSSEAARENDPTEPPHGFRHGGIAADKGDDGVTTNLYLGSLHPRVDEQTLCMAFAKFGPIGSIKIMWPRTPEEHTRQRNSGFVSFMDRESAAKAFRAMNGEEFHGHVMRIAWGKRVPIPLQPVFVLDGSNPQRLPPTGHPFNATRPMQAGRMFANGAGLASRRDDEADCTILEVQVERPLEHRLVRLIHWTVEHVIKHGAEFECLLISKTHDDARFRFLTEHEMPEHVYYRWRMYSLLNGDTKSSWRDQMFFMYDQGPIWLPPKIERGEVYSKNASSVQVGESSSEAEEIAERRRDVLPRDRLGKRARDRLERRVRRVCRPENGVIAEAMSFAVKHAYAAKDVVDVIRRSLLGVDISPSDKLCKLMLISDILHNSSAQVVNAWRLRQTFEERLSEIFDDLAVSYRSIEARLKAEHFRKQVLAVLAVWEAWMMFPQETLGKLAAAFLH